MCWIQLGPVNFPEESLGEELCLISESLTRQLDKLLATHWPAWAALLKLGMVGSNLAIIFQNLNNHPTSRYLISPPPATHLLPKSPLCYGVNPCYGVSRCYGVSLCYFVILCYYVSLLFHVIPCYVVNLWCSVRLCSAVNPCYGISLRYGVNLY